MSVWRADVDSAIVSEMSASRTVSCTLMYYFISSFGCEATCKFRKLIQAVLELRKRTALGASNI